MNTTPSGFREDTIVDANFAGHLGTDQAARARFHLTVYRVVCAANTSRWFGDLSAAQAHRADVETAHLCLHLHTVQVQVDGGAWVPLHEHRAHLILAAPVGPDPIDTPDGPLVKMQGWWLPERSHQPDVVAARTRGDWPAELAARGRHDFAALTADGRGCRSDQWCSCSPQPPADGWVRYERYSARGREAHGYLCPTCRHLVQSG
jgi:hypothetical protein